MDFLHENASIGNLVAKRPEYAICFEKLGVDYCCKGNKTLQEVCHEKNLDLAETMQKLRHVQGSIDVQNWDQMSLQEIVEYIVETYHAYSRQELPRISQLLKKLNMKHGHRYAYIAELQNVFEPMKDSLLEHMDEEEKIVFPLIIKLAAHGKSTQEEIKNYFSALDEEHLETGKSLEKIKALTDGYTSPPGACMTHIVMLNSLQRLEKNLHEHIHKENHILFSRMA